MKLMKLCYELAHQYTLTLLGLDGIAVSICNLVGLCKSCTGKDGMFPVTININHTPSIDCIQHC